MALEMPDQRLDPKRERWINAGFVLVTVAIAVLLFVIAAKFGLEQNDTGVDQSSGPAHLTQQQNH
jgi:hypothetical protein